MHGVKRVSTAAWGGVTSVAIALCCAVLCYCFVLFDFCLALTSSECGALVLWRGISRYDTAPDFSICHMAAIYIYYTS